VGRYRGWGSGTVRNVEKRSPEDADIKPPRAFIILPWRFIKTTYFRQGERLN